MLKVEHIKKAHNNIKNFAKYTPILYSEALKKDIGLELMLKAENLQTTNSFKIRGASNCLMKAMASRPNLKELSCIIGKPWAGSCLCCL